MNIKQQLYHEIETLPLDAQEKILKMAAKQKCSE